MKPTGPALLADPCRQCHRDLLDLLSKDTDSPFEGGLSSFLLRLRRTSGFPKSHSIFAGSDPWPRPSRTPRPHGTIMRLRIRIPRGPRPCYSGRRSTGPKPCLYPEPERGNEPASNISGKKRRPRAGPAGKSRLANRRVPLFNLAIQEEP